jgi:NADH-quinone oxidoreductase subunit A
MGDEAVPLNYVPILLFIGITIAFGVIQLLAGRLVRPSRPYRAKLNP